MLPPFVCVCAPVHAHVCMRHKYWQWTKRFATSLLYKVSIDQKLLKNYRPGTAIYGMIFAAGLTWRLYSGYVNNSVLNHPHDAIKVVHTIVNVVNIVMVQICRYDNHRGSVWVYWICQSLSLCTPPLGQFQFGQCSWTGKIGEVIYIIMLCALI